MFGWIEYFLLVCLGQNFTLMWLLYRLACSSYWLVMFSLLLSVKYPFHWTPGQDWNKQSSQSTCCHLQLGRLKLTVYYVSAHAFNFQLKALIKSCHLWQQTCRVNFTHTKNTFNFRWPHRIFGTSITTAIIFGYCKPGHLTSKNHPCWNRLTIEYIEHACTMPR